MTPRHVFAAITALVTVGALAACSSSPKSSKDAVFTSINGTGKITAGAPMNPYNASGNFFLGYNTMQLGFDKQNPVDPTDFFPGLAKSWASAPGKLTLELQPNAQWSDGTPVTAEDIRTSLAIALTQGNATV